MDITAQGNAFGCCSRYRECSEQRHCLLEAENPEHAQLCTYRGHLQSGNIFFGKNRKTFPHEKYQEILSLRESLDPSERAVLDDLIRFLIGRHFYLAPALWFSSVQLDRLAEAGMFEIVRADRDILDQYPFSILHKAINVKAKTKAEAIACILQSQPETVSQLCSPCCYVKIPAALWECYVEIYYDLLLPSNCALYTGRLPFDEEEMLVLKLGRTSPRPLIATSEERGRENARKS